MARSVGFDINVGDRGATTTPVKAATALERLANRLDDASRAAAKTTAAAAAAGAAVDDLGDEASRAARAVDDLGDEARGAAAAVDDLGDEARGTAGDASRLAAAIEMTRARHADLLRQMDRTGDATLIPQIRDEASTLRTLSRMRDELEKYAVAEGGLKGLMSAAGGGLSAASTLTTSIGAAAVAAAPMVGAAITEGILLGVAGAGLTAGIAGAFQAPEVQAAWSGFAETGSVVLAEAGRSFREPLISALDDADRRLRGLDLAGAIAPLADTIGPLEAGLMGLAERAMPGIRTAAEAAVVPVEQLADELPDVGDALSDMLSAASVGADGAAASMQDLLTVMEATLATTGTVVGGLGKLYEVSDQLGMTGLVGLAGNLDDTQTVMRDLNDEIHNVNPAAAEAVAGMQAMDEAMESLRQRADAARDDLSGANAAMLDSNIALAEGYDRLKSAVQDHGTSLDINTEAGRSNTRILQGMIAAAEAAADAEYEKAIATGNSSGAEAAANATRSAAIARIREHAAATGMDAGQVNALVASLSSLPRGTLDFAYRINVSVYGNVNAAQAVMNVAGGSTAGMTASQINNAQRIMNKGRASGGPVSAGEAYIVGERQPELFVPKTDGMILPRVPTSTNPTPWSPSTSAAGGGAVVLRIDSGGSRFDDLVVDVVRAAVDAAGGDVQYALGRSG